MIDWRKYPTLADAIEYASYSVTVRKEELLPAPGSEPGADGGEGDGDDQD